jgi:hypothetical protein
VVIRAGLLAACLAVPVPAGACEIALAFALDVSASVDAREYAAQRDGLARALQDPAVEEVILALPGGAALAAYEWSGRRQQTLIADWARVTDGAGLAAFAARLSQATRSHREFPTAIGYALGYAAGLLGRAPPCARRVLDISGDGVNNEGFSPSLAYREFPFEEVTVNALVIAGSEPEVIAYFRNQVIHGKGAFVEIADDYDDYAEAMRRKLLRELMGAQMVAR